MKTGELSLAGSEQKPPRRMSADILIPGILLAAAVAVLPLDFVVGQWAVKGGCPGFFRELLEAIEPFGNGNGVVYVVLAVLALDWARRRSVVRMLATAFGAGLAADVVKLTVERTRPCAFGFEGTIWDTFVRAFPLAGAGAGGQSFPSAHTATAVAFAAALAWQYPRGRLFFFSLAALVAVQRVTGGAHFVSDAFCGAVIGCVVATFTLQRGQLAAWFDCFEAKGATAADRGGKVLARKRVA